MILPPSRVLLLIRCGEIEIGVKNWVPDQQFMSQAQIGLKRPESEIGNAEAYDPYLELAVIIWLGTVRSSPLRAYAGRCCPGTGRRTATGRGQTEDRSGG